VANSNGVIDPGESALITLSFSFSPHVGALVPGSPSLRVHAFADSWLDIANVFHTPGTWTGLQIAQGWNFLSLHAGYPEPQWGGVILINPAQNHVNADLSNPIVDVWQARWTPGEYTPTTATFRTFPRGVAGFEVSSRLWVENEANPGEFSRVFAWTNITELQVPIVPSPGSGAVAGLACLQLVRRRRHRHEAHRGA
jgi:hypothetical protein